MGSARRFDENRERLMSDSPKGAAMGSGLPIAEALERNKEATEEVKKAAEDLAVVHAVLETKVAGDGRHVDDGDVTRAVAEAHRVEKELAQSAEKLESVNTTLAREVNAPR